MRQIDLFCDGEFQDSVELSGQTAFRFEGLTAGEKLVELWLPQHGEFRLRSLEISDGATISPYADTRPRWVTYGSSITHCRTAESPGLHLARSSGPEARTGPDLPGLRGQLPPGADDCPNDRELPADFLSMKVGINIYGSDSLNVRTFQSAIIGFVKIVRRSTPTRHSWSSPRSSLRRVRRLPTLWGSPLRI